MQYIMMAIIGLIVGVIARYIYPGAIQMSLIWSAVLGIAGSYLAGFIGSLLHRDSSRSAFHPAGIIYSILGALLLIYLARNVLHLV